MINKSILREYDIRGIYGKTLTDHDAFLVGWSFSKYLQTLLNRERIMVNVCRDGRHSSISLYLSLIKGLVEGGAAVQSIGIGPTPMLYFSNFIDGEVDAGIMITGSHNPPEYNGFKFIADRSPFFGEKIQKLHEISAEYKADDRHINVAVQDVSYIEEYVNKLLSVCSGIREFKIAWDPGNGAAGEVVEKLCQKLPGKHILLNEKIDGNFPAHHPDPTVVENLEQLKAAVINNNCDLGVAFDGDGDRIGVIDNLGRIIWGDQLLTILAKEILTRLPGAPIIADVKASRVFFEQIKKYGGVPVMWKTGHSNIKQHMKDIGAPLAGEMSGHIFIGDQYYGYDDALYTAVRLISLLSSSGENHFSNIVDALPKTYNTPEIRIECKDEEKFAIVEDLKKYFRDNNIEFNDIDGIRYSSKTGWGLIRASNTQEVLVCRFEADSEAEVQEQISFISRLLKEHNLTLSVD